MTRLGCCGAWAAMLWATLAVVDAADTSEALGDRYMAEGRYRLAAQAFEQAVHLSPNRRIRRKLAAAYAKDQQLARRLSRGRPADRLRQARTELAILRSRPPRRGGGDTRKGD